MIILGCYDFYCPPSPIFTYQSGLILKGTESRGGMHQTRQRLKFTSFDDERAENLKQRNFEKFDSKQAMKSIIHRFSG